jgi:hypothetical protein
VQAAAGWGTTNCHQMGSDQIWVFNPGRKTGYFIKMR